MPKTTSKTPNEAGKGGKNAFLKTDAGACGPGPRFPLLSSFFFSFLLPLSPFSSSLSHPSSFLPLLLSPHPLLRPSFSASPPSHHFFPPGIFFCAPSTTSQRPPAPFGGPYVHRPRHLLCGDNSWGQNPGSRKLSRSPCGLCLDPSQGPFCRPAISVLALGPFCRPPEGYSRPKFRRADQFVAPNSRPGPWGQFVALGVTGGGPGKVRKDFGIIFGILDFGPRNHRSTRGAGVPRNLGPPIEVPDRAETSPGGRSR